MKKNRLKPPILIALLTLSIIAMMSYSSYLGREMAERYAPLIDAAMEIKLEATTAHLWFEEIISGDRSLHIKEIWKHIDEAEWYAHAMLEGGKNNEGNFEQLDDPRLRQLISKTLIDLKAFRNIAQERWENQSQSAIGSNVDQRFDAIFSSLIIDADNVETALQQLMAQQLAQFSNIQTLLLLIVFILGTTIGLILYRHDRQHHVDLLALHNQKEKLRITLRSIGDAVITTDQSGNVTQMNPVAEQLTGWTLQEAQGISLKTIFPIIDASTRQPIQNPVDKVLETGETVYLSNHTTLIAKDDTEHQIADSAAPIRNDSGSILGMVLVFNDVSEQYRLRESLFEERLILREIIDASPDLIFLKDKNGVYLRCNNAFEEFFGASMEEIIGKTDFDFVDKDTAQFFRAKDKIVLDSRTSQVNEEIVAYPDGQKVLLETLKIPFDLSNKENSRLLGISRDITRQRQMENETRSSLQHLKLYREQAPLAAIEWNTDFQVINWNQAAQKMFGFTLEEVRGRDFVDIMLPESAMVDVKEVWQNLMEQTGGTVSINENLTKDGQTILCEWHNTALVDQSGDVIGAASLILDITSEHKTRQALSLQAKEQEEILNSLSDGVITIDEMGTVLSSNHTFEILFGYSNNEAIGQNILLFVPELDEGESNTSFKKLLGSAQEPSPQSVKNLLGQHKNKTFFPLRLSVTRLPKIENKKPRFVISCHDLTQLRAQQAQLQRAQKMDALGKLVGGIAHDYNNMLGVILGYTDLMEIKYGDIKGLQKYIGNISQAAERGRRLTKRMLAFSKQESSHAQAVSIQTLLDTQKELLSKSLTALIKLNYNQHSAPWLIWVDPSELEDALLNLTINAQHAMPEGGSLTFSADTLHLPESEASLLGLSENDYIKLSITDTGCGIATDIKNKIFDPFFSTKGTGGTGLGLSQVYGFMERVGGTVKVTSTINVGSEFTLYFPRYRDVNDNAPAQSPIIDTQQGNGEVILIVDDEPALRELLQERLTIAGYRVLSANSGDTALNALAANHVDLVLSDVIMPNMDGYQLAKRIQDKYPLIKIQLASGFSDNRHLQIENSTLHKTMLQKPFNTSDLLDRISNLLNKVKASR